MCIHTYVWMSCDYSNVYLSMLTLVCALVWIVCVAFRNCVYSLPYTLAKDTLVLTKSLLVFCILCNNTLLVGSHIDPWVLGSDFYISQPLDRMDIWVNLQAKLSSWPTILWYFIPLYPRSRAALRPSTPTQQGCVNKMGKMGVPRPNPGLFPQAVALRIKCMISYLFVALARVSPADSGELVFVFIAAVFFWQRFMVANFLSPAIQNDFYGFSVSGCH